MAKKGLPKIWTTGLSEEDAAHVVQNALNSQKEFEMVRNLIYNLYVESLSSDRVVDFESPSWAAKKAYEEGKRASFEKLLKLLDISRDDPSLHKTKRKALTDVPRKPE